MDGIAIGISPEAQECRTMSVAAAAKILGISRTTAYECVRSGDLPSVRMGGRILIPTQRIERLLAASEPEAIAG